jgi:hypothetical protein
LYDKFKATESFNKLLENSGFSKETLPFNLDQDFREVFIRVNGDTDVFLFSVKGNIAVSEKINSEPGNRQYRYYLLPSKLLDDDLELTREEILLDRAINKRKRVTFSKFYNSSEFDGFLEKNELSKSSITPQLYRAFEEFFFNVDYDRARFIKNASKNLKKAWFYREAPLRKDAVYIVPNKDKKKPTLRRRRYKEEPVQRPSVDRFYSYADDYDEEDDYDDEDSVYDPTKDESVSIDLVEGERIIERPVQAEFVDDIGGLFNDFCLKTAPEDVQYDSKKKFQVFSSEIAGASNISAITELRSSRSRYKTGLVGSDLISTQNWQYPARGWNNMRRGFGGLDGAWVKEGKEWWKKKKKLKKEKCPARALVLRKVEAEKLKGPFFAKIAPRWRHKVKALTKRLRKKEIYRYTKFPNKRPTKRVRRGKRRYRKKIKKFKKKISRFIARGVKTQKIPEYERVVFPKRRDLNDRIRDNFLKARLYSRRGSAFQKGWWNRKADASSDAVLLKTENLLKAGRKSSKYFQIMDSSARIRDEFDRTDEEQQGVYSTYITKKNIEGASAGLSKNSAGTILHRLFEIEDRMPGRRMTEAWNKIKTKWLRKKKLRMRALIRTRRVFPTKLARYQYLRKKNRRRFIHRKYYLRRAHADFDKVKKKIESSELSILQKRLAGKLCMEELKLLVRECVQAGIPKEALLSNRFMVDAFRFSKRKSRAVAKTIRFNNPDENNLLEQSAVELRDFLNANSKKNERVGFMIEFLENFLFEDGSNFTYVPWEQSEALKKSRSKVWQFSRAEAGYEHTLTKALPALGLNLEENVDDLSYKILRNARKADDAASVYKEHGTYFTDLPEKEDAAAESSDDLRHYLIDNMKEELKERAKFNYNQSLPANLVERASKEKKDENDVKIVGVGGGNFSKSSSAKLLEQVGTPLYEFAGTIEENNRFKKAKDNMTVLFIDERARKGVSFEEILKNPKLLESSPNIASEPALREVFKERLLQESASLSKHKRITARLWEPTVQLYKKFIYSYKLNRHKYSFKANKLFGKFKAKAFNKRIYKQEPGLNSVKSDKDSLEETEFLSKQESAKDIDNWTSNLHSVRDSGEKFQIIKEIHEAVEDGRKITPGTVLVNGKRFRRPYIPFAASSDLFDRKEFRDALFKKGLLSKNDKFNFFRSDDWIAERIRAEELKKLTTPIPDESRKSELMWWDKPEKKATPVKGSEATAKKTVGEYAAKLRKALSEKIRKYKDFLRRNKKNKDIEGHYGFNSGEHRSYPHIETPLEDTYFSKIGPRLTYRYEKSRVQNKKYRKLRRKRRLKKFWHKFDSLWRYAFEVKKWFFNIRFTRSLLSDFLVLYIFICGILIFFNFRIWLIPVIYVTKFLIKCAVLIFFYFFTAYDIIVLTQVFVFIYVVNKLWKWGQPVKKKRIKSGGGSEKKNDKK